MGIHVFIYWCKFNSNRKKTYLQTSPDLHSRKGNIFQTGSIFTQHCYIMRVLDTLKKENNLGIR